MECDEPRFRTRLPVGVGQMMELIEVHGRDAELHGEVDGQRRLAGVGRTEDDDALAEGSQGRRGSTGTEKLGQTRRSEPIVLSRMLRNPCYASNRLEDDMKRSSEKILIDGIWAASGLTRSEWNMANI